MTTLTREKARVKPKAKPIPPISVEEFDRLFDEGSDEIDKYIDWNSVTTWEKFAEANGLPLDPQPVQTISVNVQPWLVEALEQEAAALHISREDVIRVWLAEKARSLQPPAQPPAQAT